MEWLFLTCHNYWIVCRLVRDDKHPYLAFSPEISIKDSSKPLRAFLGAVLSVSKNVPVEASSYNPDVELCKSPDDPDRAACTDVHDIKSDLMVCPFHSIVCQ